MLAGSLESVTPRCVLSHRPYETEGNAESRMASDDEGRAGSESCSPPADGRQDYCPTSGVVHSTVRVAYAHLQSGRLCFCHSTCSLPHSSHFACTKSPPPDDLHLVDSLTPKCEMLHARTFNGSGRLAILQPIRAHPSVSFPGQSSGTLHELSPQSATGL